MFKIITIPFNRSIKGFDDEILNCFSLNKHITGYHTAFFLDGEEKYWTVFLEYDPVLEETSEKELEKFDESQRLLFVRLKEWRKERAEKDGVPVFIIGTNRELADIVRMAPRSLEALKAIKGFGKGKISKYGNEIIQIINGFYEKS